MDKKINKINLKQWVNDFTKLLYYRALYKVSDDELAKDLVQETFLAAAENISSFKGDSAPKTWLFAILNHKIIDYYRSKNKQPVSTDPQSFLSFFDEHEEWRNEKKA
ncbi:MAG: RNA polymerase sigma factor [Bacteroidales bacterium]